MALGKVITVIVCVLILYLVISLWFGSATHLSSLNDGTKELQISSNKLSSGKGRVTNFAYSVWFYVNDWNYKFGQPKIIFERMGPKGQVSPQVSFDSFENNLAIKLALFNVSNNDENNIGSNVNMSKPTIHTCNIPNVPLQRWVNLIISVYGRSLDVYIDGKLVRTCVLENSATFLCHVFYEYF